MNLKIASPLPMRGVPPIRRLLGSGLFVDCFAKQVPGTLIWVNFDLLHLFDFSIPSSNCLSPGLRDQLVLTFSLRVAHEPEAESGPTVRLFADRYGGKGLGWSRGSGRGAFHPAADLFLKGIGNTPLSFPDPNDVFHSHGGFHMWQGLYVAALKEVCDNLFTNKPARILALIDQKEDTIYPSGEVLPRAIAVRAGNQLRPAHILPRRRTGDRTQRSIFIAMTRSTGQLVTRSGPRGGKPRADLSATMRRVIDDHARTAAEHARWRLSHGSITASNMLLDGGPLDLAQARTNPRSPPLSPEYGLDDEWIPRTDYMDRVDALVATYGVLSRTIGDVEKKQLNVIPLDIASEFDEAYFRHLSRAIVSATGLKSVAADCLIANHPQRVSRFVTCIVGLTNLANPGCQSKNMKYDETSAVVDVFNLLATYPLVFFTDLQQATESFVEVQLKPHFDGDRQLIDENKKALGSLCKQFVLSYRELMDAAFDVSLKHYSSSEAMKSSVITRAAFENRPIEEFYADSRTVVFKNAANAYRKDGDPGAIRKLIRTTVARSVRNIDALLSSGERRTLPNGDRECQIKLMDGLRYSVMCLEENTHILVSIRFTPINGGFRAEISGEPHITDEQLKTICFHFSVDGWRSSQRCRGKTIIEEHSVVVEFEAYTVERFADLQGEFWCGDVVVRDGPGAFSGYTFALPDSLEISSLFAISS